MDFDLCKEAMKELDEANALPLSKLDEFEKRSREAMKKMTRSGLDAFDLVESNARLIATTRSFVHFLDRWVNTATGAWVGSSLVIVILAVLSFFHVHTVEEPQSMLIINAIAFFGMLYFRYDRRRELKKPIVSRDL